MIAAGHLNKAIAQTLQISPWTICTHLRRIFGKLGVHSRAAMVAKSFELGLAAQHGEKGSDLVIIHPPVLPLSTDGSPSHSERINDRQFQRGDSHAADRPHAEGVGIRS